MESFVGDVYNFIKLVFIDRESMSAEWAKYLAVGGWNNNPTTLYHMSEMQRFSEFLSGRSLYFPPTYNQDGFIHATAVPSLLIEVANHFYQDSRDDWICMEIDPQFLGCKVIYEGAAPVGNKASKFASDEEEEGKPLFPHIYGGINKLAIRKVHKIVRDSTGKFVSIEGVV